MDQVANRLGLTFSEATLATFFVAMVLLSCYGFQRFFLDCLYIYTFPFIVCYKLIIKIIKIAIKIPSLAAHYVPGIRPSVPWMVIVRETLPDASMFPTLNQPQPNAEIATLAPPPAFLEFPKSTPELQSGVKKWLWVKVGLPVRSFAFAWCLLILLSEKQSFVLFGLVVLSAQLAAFIVGLARRLAHVRKLLIEWETRIVAYASGLVEIIISAPEGSLDNQNVGSATSILAALRGASFLIINRVEVSYAFFVVGCFMYVLVYFRIALLFAFVYLGIAKLNHLPLRFLDSMTNSIAMPLSYTNFPRNWQIQLAEDCHSLVAIVLGFEALRAFLQGRMEAFLGLAEQIWEKLNEATLRVKMAEAARRAKPAAGAYQAPPAAAADRVE